MIALLLALALQDAAAIDAAAAKIPGMNDLRWKAVDDAEFLARITKDLWGEAPGDATAFVDDKTPDKRARKVDALLASPKFAAHWGRRLAVWLIGEPAAYRVRLDGLPAAAERAIADAFVEWTTKGVAEDRPWTDTVRALVEARGKAPDVPELGWKLGFTARKDPRLEIAIELANRTLGIRLGCAVCHDHPYDRWTVQDTFGFAAFLVRDQARLQPGGAQAELGVADAGEMFVYRGQDDGVAKVKLAQGGIAPPVFLFGGTAGKNDDRPKMLAQLLTSRATTQLPRAFANHVWAWLLGKGVVDPPDDFNLRNKAASPALLEALTRSLVDGGHRLKPLLRAILASRIYQCVDTTDPAQAAWTSFRGQIVRPPAPASRPFGAFTLALPPEWTLMPPERPGFSHPYRVPGKAGSAVFASGGSSLGDVVRQVAGGKPAVEKVDGPLQLTLTDVTGTYSCDPTSAKPRENWRILIARLQKEASIRDFRLEGPPETVGEWRDRFVEMLRKAEMRDPAERQK